MKILEKIVSSGPNVLAGKPISVTKFKDGEILVYDATKKQWKAGTTGSSASLESQIDAATAKTLLVDTDTFALTEPTTLKKTLWSTIKSTLKTYFDGLYLALTGGTITGNLVIKPATDAVASVEVVNQGNYDVFTIDTLNDRVGIGLGDTNTAPQKRLDVSGDINFVKVTPALASFTLTEDANASYNLVATKQYYYTVVFVTAAGDAFAFDGASYYKAITIGATNARVVITNIPTSTDPRVTGRKIFRSLGIPGGNMYLRYRVTTINDNVTTSYTDNIADASLVTTDGVYRRDNWSVKGIYINNSIFAMMGIWNISYGANSLGNLTTGIENIAFGVNNTLVAITSGSTNIGIGSGALLSLTTGYNNIGIGYATLGSANLNSAYNVCIGDNAGRLTGTAGVVSGSVGLGFNALNNIVAGNHYNTGVGFQAGRGFQGSYNIFLGALAGDITAGTIGSYNIIIGYDSGDNLASGADGNIIIGRELDIPVTNGDNQLTIGNLIFGTGLDGTGLTISTGKIGIGTTTPDKRLEINSVDGNCLRLTYNDANGSATYYADFNVSAAGLLTINASGGIINTANDIEITDTTKGIILKSPDGSRWRVTVDNSGNLITTSI